MNCVILSCSTLKDYVQAAQEACHTDFPVVFLDRRYHVEPSRMRAHILETLQDLPEEIDTVLVAMGFLRRFVAGCGMYEKAGLSTGG